MVSYRKLLYVLLGFVILNAAACTGPVSFLGVSSGQLEGTQWQLNSYGPQGSEAALAEGAQITMAFTGKNSVGGTDGCNTFEGNYEVGYGSIAFHNLQRTPVACTRQGLIHQEIDDYLQALSQTDRYEIRGDQLIIWYGNEKYTLIFIRSHPPGQVGANLDQG